MRRILSTFLNFFSLWQSSLDFQASVPCWQARILDHDSRARQRTEGLGQRPAMGSCGRNTRTRTSFSVKQPHPQNPGSTRVLGRPSRFEVDGLSSSRTTASAGNLNLTCWMRAQVTTTTSPEQVPWIFQGDLPHQSRPRRHQLATWFFVQDRVNPLFHQESPSTRCPFGVLGDGKGSRQRGIYAVDNPSPLHDRVDKTTWAWRLLCTLLREA